MYTKLVFFRLTGLIMQNINLYELCTYKRHDQYLQIAYQKFLVAKKLHKKKSKLRKLSDFLK